MYHDAVVQFIRMNTIVNVIGISSGCAFPLKGGITGIGMSLSVKSLHAYGKYSITFSKYPKVCDGKFPIGHMHILKFQVPRTKRLHEFDVIVRHIGLVVAFVDKDFPIHAIIRMVDPVLMEDILSLVAKCCSLISIIYLDRMYVAFGAEVHCQKLSGSI